MPSKSAKQHRLMEMVAHNPKMAKKVGIPQSVGKDFAEADKGKKFGVGGSPTITRGGKGMINRQATRFGSVFGEEKNVPNVNLNKYVGKKEGGVMKKEMMHDDEAEDKKLIKKMVKPNAVKPGMKKGGMPMKKMAMGGSVKPSKMGSVKTSANRDGVAVKGKTKGRVC
jgi:hypothetical protein